VEALAPWTAVRGVAVHVEGQAMASVDVDALARAIDNLVRNSVEASPPGGRVRIAVGLRGDGATIRVEDHGAGVPAERVPELFEPFFTTKPNGTGLGLAICRSIARAHGGDVTFTRRQNDATTCVELTVARWSSVSGSASAAGAGVAVARDGALERAIVAAESSERPGDAASGFGTPPA
jgi:signal transduction histidine kinase